jgi:quinol-cytochrome oxidoreductase complex cytochrome b subunit
LKITVWTWKDERWSANKEDLQAINNLINKEKKVRNGDKFFYILGCFALFPFIIRDYTGKAIKFLIRKIKRK